MHDFIGVLGLPLLACLSMLSILGYLGIHVLKREIIFIDIALAQIVAVGAIFAHLYLHAHEGSLVHYAVTLGFALFAAAFYALSRWKIVDVPLEAVIGVSYAIAAAGALFLIGIDVGGHVHVQHMLAGSILWAKGPDVLGSTIVFAGVGLAFFLLRRPFGEISEDYEAARRRGRRVVLWDFVFYTLVGIVITVAVCLSGVVLLFAFLIIPATTSALFSARWGPRLLITWGIGAAASVMGLIFVYRLDFSVGPAVALFLGICLVLAAALRAWRPWLSVPVVGLTIAGYAGLMAAASSSSPETNPRDKQPHVIIEPETVPEELSAEEVRAKIARAETGNEFRSLYNAIGDPSLRAELVERALSKDARCGADLALDFLGQDPPLFFRQGVVEALSLKMESPLDYDVTKPFADMSNQEVISKVAKKYGLKTR